MGGKKKKGGKKKGKKKKGNLKLKIGYAADD